MHELTSPLIDVPVAGKQQLLSQELRQAGAMLLITRRRSQQLQPETFLIHDASKSEMSAGLPHNFTKSGDRSLGLIAGGRDFNNYDQPETITETLRRETEEELGEVLGDVWTEIAPAVIHSLDSIPFSDLEQQHYPFIVGQRKQIVETDGTEATTRINEIAATTLYAEFDSLPLEMRRALERAVTEEQAQWVRLSALTTAFQEVNQSGIIQLDKQLVRPQVLSAAVIYNLQTNPYIHKSVLENVITDWNKKAYAFLSAEAQVAGIDVNNGTMSADGRVINSLPAHDHQYLNTTRK